ncbi:hypothetical protein COLSTE_02487 [Collinsella stercoris DSM 13279]|uniref:Uncharacterized protein n=1 Tax=Collinsella stercoris DSM 13279 TaxID=445975 RepID=B6GEE4_9ACTN|nr:hypothetical protein COLSTE_02487 [Collinsella stercoris DSM 13279]
MEDNNPSLAERARPFSKKFLRMRAVNPGAALEPVYRRSTQRYASAAVGNPPCAAANRRLRRASTP